MKCQICHHFCVPDLPGREPVAKEICEGEVIVLCRLCAEEYEVRLSKVHTERRKIRFMMDFLKKASASCWFLLAVLITFNLNAEPTMTCSATTVEGMVVCKVNEVPENLSVMWFTSLYGELKYNDFGNEVKLPITAVVWTRITAILYEKEIDNAKQRFEVWARFSQHKVEFLRVIKGQDPNKEKPQTYQKACIASVLGVEGRVFYEPVLIISENADEYIVIKEGYDKPVNIPKEKILLQGQSKMVKGADGQVRRCTCPAR